MSLDVAIGRRATTLTLPQEGPETYGRSAPPAERPIPKFPPPPIAEPRAPELFATLSHAAVTPADAVVVEAIRLRWRDEAFATSLKDRSSFAVSDHSKEVGAWLATVIDWLAAWYGEGRERGYWEPRPPVRIVLVDDPDEQAFYAEGGGIPSVGGGVIVERPELVAAFAAASLGTGPPLEYQLIADARFFAMRGDYRYAVINACTAAEIALAQSEDGQPGENELDPSGIAERYKLIAGRRESLPVSVNRVIDQLAGPRNDAAHRGDLLTRDTARRALRTASELLASFAPLPRPRDDAHDRGG